MPFFRRRTAERVRSKIEDGVQTTDQWKTSDLSIGTDRTTMWLIALTVGQVASWIERFT